VLTTDTMQQALERAGIKSNLGWEYAMSALEMGSLMRQLHADLPQSNNNNSPSLPASRIGATIGDLSPANE
jgi:6,7-dimethyl-8-ribityllumazine synthase